MRPSRHLVTSVFVVAVMLLIGARSDRCGVSSLQRPVLCPLVCEHGFKHDSEGHAYCECLESPVCIQIAPGPFLSPVTGKCVIFPTVCDVPSGWEPCGPGCEIDGGFVLVGETVPAGDGCNRCTCLEGGALACTEIACPVCEYEGREYRVGSRFPAGDGCNFCVCRDDGRVACTLQPCPICPPPEPTPRDLCERTGGRWDEGSCGHYVCGRFPACDAVIPGCDCGPKQSFRDGEGCVADPTCPDACARDLDCPVGSRCNPCPPDPTCPQCTVCGPPVCEPIVCSFDPDCPPGSHCEGSSVCPPDVVCVWEGRPGVCVPDGDR